MRSFLIFILFLVLSACSEKPISEQNPDELYKEAERDTQSDRYELALEKYRMIKNKFPYSRYANESHLRIADVYFLQELYAEAAAAYEIFIELHPKHEKVRYALYRVGESHEADAPSKVARDLSALEKAMIAYREFIKKFPNDPKTQDAEEKVKLIQTKLAQKEFYIANYYFGQDEYISARSRLKKIIKLYPETDLALKAREKLIRVEEKIIQKGKESNNEPAATRE